MKKMISLIMALLISASVGLFSSCDTPTDSSSSSPSASSSCEHTYELVSNEYLHQKVITCGCPSPDIAELHTDNDDNLTCDVCEYVNIIKDESNKSIISISPEIESQFDLSQEKVWWELNPNADFTDDRILICFKKTTTYPELSIEDFNFENAESITYLALRPGENYVNTEKYSQIAVINLKEKGYSKLIEAILYFERIQQYHLLFFQH